MKDWETVESEIADYHSTRRYKVDQFVYKIRRLFSAPMRYRSRIKHYNQRGHRGFSDYDAWNGDAFLAGQIAGIMDWIVEKGHGVSMAYADGDLNTSTEEMVLRRNADYAKYGAIFHEYHKNGSAYNQDWKDEFGGVLDNDMKEALQWLVEHFQELWD